MEASRRGHLRPYHRVLLVTFVAVLGAGTGLGLILVQSSQPRADLAKLSRLESIDSRLAEVGTQDRAGANAFDDALSATDDASRTDALQRSQTATQNAQKAWGEYRRLSLNLPGEKAIQTQYDAESTASRDAGVVLFTTNAQAEPFRYAAAAVALRDSGEKTQLLIADLREKMYQPLIDRTELHAAAGVDRLRHVVPWFIVGAVLFGILVASMLTRGALREERLARNREDERERQIRRSDLETRVQRGLEMTRTEEASYEVVGSALGHTVGDQTAELLIADSSRAHFRQVLATGTIERGCAVSAPNECPAAHTGQVRVFVNSDDIDACPFLRGRPGGACSAACIPLSVAGRSIGVLHVVGDESQPPSPNSVMDLTLVAQRAGEHIGLLRAMAKSDTQAHTDSLTGLLNRRSIEAAAHGLVREGTPFVVAFADLDHFKQLNDTHGHETGDRALRMFARVLRDSVRPTDIPARYGGEEFVIVLPDCTINDAVAVGQRLRARLAAAVQNASVPPFTVSIGVARAGPDNGLTETIARADEALLAAKAGGRDRVQVFPGDELESSESAEVSELPTPFPALRLPA